MLGPYNFFYLPFEFIQTLPVPLHPNPYLLPTPSAVWAPLPESTPIKIQHEVSSGEGLSIVKTEEQASQEKSEGKVSRFKYAKKNVESNVVNQVISFCKTKCKSKRVLMRVLGSEEKVETFYEIMKQAKKKNSGYVGRSFLQNLLEVDEDHPIYILYKRLKKFKVALKLVDIKRGLRHLCNYFLRNMIVPTVLTSSKLDKTTIRQHLVRAREIYCYVNSLPSPYN